MKKLFVDEALSHIGDEIELFGWADTVRDHKKVVFIDLRDSSGKVQIVGVLLAYYVLYRKKLKNNPPR